MPFVAPQRAKKRPSTMYEPPHRPRAPFWDLAAPKQENCTTVVNEQFPSSIRDNNHRVSTLESGVGSEAQCRDSMVCVVEWPAPEAPKQWQGKGSPDSG